MHAVLCAVAGRAGLGADPARPASWGDGSSAAGALLAVGTGYWSPRPLLIALVLFAVLVVMVETRQGTAVGPRPAHVGVAQRARQLALRARLPGRCAWSGRRIDGADQGRLPAPARVRRPRVPRWGRSTRSGCACVAYPLERDHAPLRLRPHRRVAVAELLGPGQRSPSSPPLLVAVVLLVARRGTDRGRPRRGGVQRRRRCRPRATSPWPRLLITPVLARGLAGSGHHRRATRRGLVPAVGLVALVALGVALTAGAVRRPAYDLSLYPVAEVTWLADHHLVPGRVATTDYVGQLPRVPLRHPGQRLHRRPGRRLPACGRDGLRHPAQRVRGLAGGARRATAFDVVLWPRSDALASLIAQDPGGRPQRQPGWWPSATARRINGVPRPPPPVSWPAGLTTHVTAPVPRARGRQEDANQVTAHSPRTGADRARVRAGPRSRPDLRRNCGSPSGSGRESR